MMDISVIVPVYKVEEYLDRCYQSIINQTYQNFELIFINDGSPDNCPMLCECYAKTDARIVVIHQENQGLSQARNTGLKKARGKYVIFIDSDDFIEVDTLEFFMQNVVENNVDIVTGEAKRIWGNKIHYLKNYNSHGEIFSGREYLTRQLQNNLYPVSACVNLYRREFLMENSLLFKGEIYHEDEEWTPRVFLKAKRVISSNKNFYNYIIRNNSITRAINTEKHALDLEKICELLIKIFKNEKDPLRNCMYRHVAQLHFMGINYGLKYYERHRDEIKREFLLEYIHNKKQRLLLKILLKNIYIYRLLKTMKNYIYECL